MEEAHMCFPLKADMSIQDVSKAWGSIYTQPVFMETALYSQLNLKWFSQCVSRFFFHTENAEKNLLQQKEHFQLSAIIKSS